MYIWWLCSVVMILNRGRCVHPLKLSGDGNVKLSLNWRFNEKKKKKNEGVGGGGVCVAGWHWPAPPDVVSEGRGHSGLGSLSWTLAIGKREGWWFKTLKIKTNTNKYKPYCNNSDHCVKHYTGGHLQMHVFSEHQAHSIWLSAHNGVVAFSDAEAEGEELTS